MKGDRNGCGGLFDIYIYIIIITIKPSCITALQIQIKIPIM